MIRRANDRISILKVYPNNISIATRQCAEILNSTNTVYDCSRCKAGMVLRVRVNVLGLVLAML